MGNDFRNQIYARLNLKDTDELVDIWQKNDRVEWTEIAFDVMRDILLERVDPLPPQNEPIFDHKELSSDTEIDENFEEVLSKTENGPVFYQPKQVLWLNRWINRAAVAAIIIITIASLFQTQTTQRIVWSYFYMDPNRETLSWVIALPIVLLGITFESVLVYFPLKALNFILRILMEMEFNSRSSGIMRKQNPVEDINN